MRDEIYRFFVLNYLTPILNIGAIDFKFRQLIQSRRDDIIITIANDRSDKTLKG